MIIKTHDEFKIDGSKEEIVNDIFEILLAFAKKSKGEFSVHMMVKDLTDLYSKKVEEQISADIEKLYKNLNYGLFPGTKKSLALMKDIKLKTIFDIEVDNVLAFLNENANPKYSFHITNEADQDELDVMMHMGDAILLNFAYNRSDCQLSKVITKEINWHLHQISINDKDYYNGCDAEYLQGYWRNLLIGIKDILSKV